MGVTWGDDRSESVGTGTLLRETVEFPSLEIFKTRLDAILCNLL